MVLTNLEVDQCPVLLSDNNNTSFKFEKEDPEFSPGYKYLRIYTNTGESTNTLIRFITRKFQVYCVGNQRLVIIEVGHQLRLLPIVV